LSVVVPVELRELVHGPGQLLATEASIPVGIQHAEQCGTAGARTAKAAATSKSSTGETGASGSARTTGAHFLTSIVTGLIRFLVLFIARLIGSRPIPFRMSHGLLNTSPLLADARNLFDRQFVTTQTIKEASESFAERFRDLFTTQLAVVVVIPLRKSISSRPAARSSAAGTWTHRSQIIPFKRIFAQAVKQAIQPVPHGFGKLFWNLIAVDLSVLVLVQSFEQRLRRSAARLIRLGFAILISGLGRLVLVIHRGCEFVLRKFSVGIAVSVTDKLLEEPLLFFRQFIAGDRSIVIRIQSFENGFGRRPGFFAAGREAQGDG
jgi:hypothetical protein